MSSIECALKKKQSLGDLFTLTEHFRTSDPEIEENLELLWQCCFLKSFHKCKSKREKNLQRSRWQIYRCSSDQLLLLYQVPACISDVCPPLRTCQGFGTFVQSHVWLIQNLKCLRLKATFRYQLLEFPPPPTYLALWRLERMQITALESFQGQCPVSCSGSSSVFLWLHVCI